MLGAIIRLLMLLGFFTGLLICLQGSLPGYPWWLGGVLVLIGCGFAMLNLQHLIKSGFEGLDRPSQLWPPLILLTTLPSVTIHWLFDIGSFSTAGLFIIVLAYSISVVQAYNRMNP